MRLIQEFPGSSGVGYGSASSQVRRFFNPEDAPTDRLRTMTHFWDSEVGLQIINRSHPNLPAETLSLLEGEISKAVGDTQLDPPLTREEAQFLLNHREPIFSSYRGKN